MLLGAGARRRGAWTLVLALLAAALVFPVAAEAATLTVDSTGDEADLPAAGCATAVGKCTLRAAIEVANATVGGGEEIAFDPAVFDGGSGSTIVLGANLPPLVKPVSVDGGRCATAAGAEGPCVAVDGTDSGAVFKVEADAVKVEGVAIFDSATGISVVDAREFELRGNWFGVRLDGTSLSAVNGTGVLVGPGSADGQIGGKGPEDGNLFANDVDGVEIVGGSRVATLGNRFGFGPDGTPNGYGNNKAITIVSTDAFEALDNVVGASLDPAAAATPACDGGCNLIAEAEYSIVLAWEGHGPAVDTHVIGNQLGIDAAGTGSAPNGDGISGGVGTVIGGFEFGDGNRINGGGSAIRVGGSEVAIVGNQIGVDVGATEVFHPPSDAITVFDEGLGNPADEALIAGNVIGLEGGSGIDQRGLGATIVDNVIAGAGIGVFTSDADKGHGSLIEGNLIEGSENAGVMIENDFNEVFGNEIFESGVGGIEVIGRNSLAATGNVIGGDSPAEENEISFSGGDAIVLAGAEGSENEAGRNHGTENEGLFIRLWEYEPGPIGPNGGIEPPGISSLTVDGVAGTAEPGARVRVFRKESDGEGEVQGFLGEAVAGLSGAWKVTYPAPVPGGTYVAATQTNVAGGTSELAIAKTPGGTETVPGGGSGGSGSPAARPTHAPAADKTPPETKIVKVRLRSHRAVIRFSSTEPGSSFQCRLDRKRFRPCGSPVRYRRLAAGRHRFEVRAVDAAGNVDPTPARRTFLVPRGHR